jgi:hypothetical protein
MSTNNANNNQISPTKYVAFERILTPSDIYGMFASQLTLIASPGVGKAIIVMPTIVVGQIYTGTAYTSGGQISLFYGGTAQAIGAIPATTLTTASSITRRANATLSNVDLSNVSNKSMTISNITGAFATGTGNVRVQFLYFIIDTV